MSIARSVSRSVSGRVARRVAAIIGGGTNNLLLAPSDLSDPAWTHSTSVIDPDTETDPVGGADADGIDFVGTAFGFYDDTAGSWVTDYPEDITFTTEWVEYEREVTTPANCVSLRVYPARTGVAGELLYQTVEVLPETSYVLKWWAKVDGSNTYIWNVRFRRGTLATVTVLTADNSNLTADNSNLTADLTEAVI